MTQLNKILKEMKELNYNAKDARLVLKLMNYTKVIKKDVELER